MKSWMGLFFCFSVFASAHMVVHPVIPIEAKQSWTMKQYDITETVPSHYQKVRRQFLVSIEGNLQVSCNGHVQPLAVGELICIEPGINHEIFTEGSSRFFSIDLPGFPFPEDVFENELSQGSIEWEFADAPMASDLEERYFGPRMEKGSYAVYNLVSSQETKGKYGVALLEILDSPKHFHHSKLEQFIVVKGLLQIEIEGMKFLLKTGDSIAVYPGQTHKLSSAGADSVRVLCFSFPASSSQDLVLVD
ncbi:MAG: cupin domain-containing protein [Rhabdochlamydiaceae bacterium]|nr:cupin domain-containing protein [Rhabdochlamydiaceae bacterium]